MNWISVKDRLPEFEVIVLVYNEAYRGIYCATLSLINKQGPQWSYATFGCASIGNSVTHWMPLPERPKQ